MFRHILIPTDGSELAAQALDKGLALAAAIGASATVLIVTESFHIFSTGAAQVGSSMATYEAESRAHADDVLGRARQRAEAAGVSVNTVHKRDDHPWQAIIDAAKDGGCDLIAMASHGRRGMAAVLLGSQTSKVLTHSDIPVLVYR